MHVPHTLSTAMSVECSVFWIPGRFGRDRLFGRDWGIGSGAGAYDSEMRDQQSAWLSVWGFGIGSLSVPRSGIRDWGVR